MATITLDVDDQVLSRAKEIAISSNVSVESYLSELLNRLERRTLHIESLPPVTKSALGTLKGIPNGPVKELVQELRAKDCGNQ